MSEHFELLVTRSRSASIRVPLLPMVVLMPFEEAYLTTSSRSSRHKGSPPFRKTPSFSELQGFLSSCTFKVAVCSEIGETGWTEGGLDYLADVLRGAFEQLVREDAIIKAVDVLNAGIDEFARLVFTSPATVQRAAEILGIRELPKRSRKKSADEEL